MVGHFNAYDRALTKLWTQLALMTEKVEERLEQAKQVFVQQDSDRVPTLIEADDEIDNMDEMIEMEALDLIALQQPVDRDLRFLAAAIRISHDLERIADYASDIGAAALQICQKGAGFNLPVDLTEMFQAAQLMLHKTLKALAERNLVIARQMDDDDQEIDRLYVQFRNQLTAYMKKSPDDIDQACSVLLVARYLERIGDHVVNIAEMLIFIETGERHPYKTGKAAGNQK